MKTVGLILLVAMFGFTRHAHAQGGAFGGPIDGLEILIVAVEASFAVSGIATGIGSSVSVAQGTVDKRWFVTGGIMGTINIAMAVGALGNSKPANPINGNRGFDPLLVSVGVGHLAIGLWNLVMPTIGFLRGRSEPGPTVVPMVFIGRGTSGSRWAGLGFQVSGF